MQPGLGEPDHGCEPIHRDTGHHNTAQDGQREQHRAAHEADHLLHVWHIWRVQDCCRPRNPVSLALFYSLWETGLQNKVVELRFRVHEHATELHGRAIAGSSSRMKMIHNDRRRGVHDLFKLLRRIGETERLGLLFVTTICGQQMTQTGNAIACSS